MLCNIRKHAELGTSLVEMAIATTLIAAFFGTIFEVNAVCLRYINASKESVAAIQGVQTRLEVLRNLAFTDLTNATFVQNLMVNPADASDFAKTKPAEVVTIKAYNTGTGSASGTGVQISRPAGAIVTPSITGSLPSATVVLVNVTYTWNMLGGRPRREQAETIISAGTKK
jgi:hypothetical protein